jgi:hypothetical protein
VEESASFHLSADRARRWCEIGWIHRDGLDVERTREDQRLVLQLGASLVAVNVWLMLSPDVPMKSSTQLSVCLQREKGSEWRWTW